MQKQSEKWPGVQYPLNLISFQVMNKKKNHKMLQNCEGGGILKMHDIQIQLEIGNVEENEEKWKNQCNFFVVHQNGNFSPGKRLKSR